MQHPLKLTSKKLGYRNKPRNLVISVNASPLTFPLVLNRKLQFRCRSKDSQMELVKYGRKSCLNKYKKLIKISIIVVGHLIDFYKL